jgi:transcriptional regulator
MYIPNNYKNEDANDIKNFIKHHSFGILVTHGDGKTLATHIPLELAINKRGKEVLQGHIAKKNPQKVMFLLLGILMKKFLHGIILPFMFMGN